MKSKMILAILGGLLSITLRARLRTKLYQTEIPRNELPRIIGLPWMQGDRLQQQYPGITFSWNIFAGLGFLSVLPMVLEFLPFRQTRAPKGPRRGTSDLLWLYRLDHAPQWS